jgi:hypothetical protein
MTMHSASTSTAAGDGYGCSDSCQRSKANFINYSVAQNATASYVRGDLGVWFEAEAAQRQVFFSGCSEPLRLDHWKR